MNANHRATVTLAFLAAMALGLAGCDFFENEPDQMSGPPPPPPPGPQDFDWVSTTADGVAGSITHIDHTWRIDAGGHQALCSDDGKFRGGEPEALTKADQNLKTRIEEANERMKPQKAFLNECRNKSHSLTDYDKTSGCDRNRLRDMNGMKEGLQNIESLLGKWRRENEIRRARIAKARAEMAANPRKKGELEGDIAEYERNIKQNEQYITEYEAKRTEYQAQIARDKQEYAEQAPKCRKAREEYETDRCAASKVKAAQEAVAETENWIRNYEARRKHVQACRKQHEEASKPPSRATAPTVEQVLPGILGTIRPRPRSAPPPSSGGHSHGN